MTKQEERINTLKVLSELIKAEQRYVSEGGDDETLRALQYLLKKVV